jgi:PAS domain S-box-containing protein
VGRDITAHKRVDRTLRALLESAPDAVVVVGPEGRIAFVNRQTEELFGHPRDHLLGRDFETLLPARLRAVGPDRVTAFAEPDRRQTGAALELVGLRADGSEFPIEMTFSPLEAPEGVLVYAAIRDITERKLIDEELRRSNRDLEQFAYVASHDLSEPLRVIAGFTDLLARRYRGQLDTEADRFINFIVSGVERLQALIDDLLAYSRAGRGDIELQRVDTDALVREVLWSLEPQLTAKHVSVEVDKLPVVRAEPALLRQIFQNLISNAVKFCDSEEPRITVRAADVGEEWRFEIEDNGPGVDPRHAERVFEMFQRLHGREVAGSGMGLAIVKRLTERHGGRVWVMPASPRGSIFSFTIPDRARRA